MLYAIIFMIEHFTYNTCPKLGHSSQFVIFTIGSRFSTEDQCRIHTHSQLNHFAMNYPITVISSLLMVISTAATSL